jgi:hypothetical protein
MAILPLGIDETLIAKKEKSFMKRILIVAAMMCCTIPAFSQAPKAEFFGGYSCCQAGQCEPQCRLDRICNRELQPLVWHRGRRQRAVDVNGQYWREDMSAVSGGSLVAATSKLDILSYRVGPKFSFRIEDSPVTPFAHVLFGAARTTAGGSTSSSGIALSASQGSNGVAGVAGGGIDIGKGPIAVRGQGDYSVLNISDLFGLSGISNGVRVSAGVVFRMR